MKKEIYTIEDGYYEYHALDEKGNVVFVFSDDLVDDAYEEETEKYMEENDGELPTEMLDLTEESLRHAVEDFVRSELTTDEECDPGWTVFHFCEENQDFIGNEENLINAMVERLCDKYIA